MSRTLRPDDLVTRPMSRRAMLGIAVSTTVLAALGSCARPQDGATTPTDPGDAPPREPAPSSDPSSGGDADTGANADPTGTTRPPLPMVDSDRGPTSDVAGS